MNIKREGLKMFLAQDPSISKFLEVKLVDKMDTVDFQATQLRMDENYIFYYTHWTRLLATGVIPFLYLVIINTIIIIKVRERRLQSLKLSQNLKMLLKYLPL